MSTLFYFFKTKSFLLLLFPVFMMIDGDKLSDPNQFKGMWKLDRYEVLNAGKWQADSTKIGYSGFILYDGLGHMSVQILPANYNSFDLGKDLNSLSIEDVQILADHYHLNFVYFANYSVHENIVEHTVQSCTEPVNIGKVLKREFEFKGDTLLLTPITPEGKKSRLRWIKLPGS